MILDRSVGDGSEMQLRHACAELAQRLRSGDDCRAEQILDLSPSLASNISCVLELIYTEFVTRRELGQKPDPLAWIARFPQWQDQLRHEFEVKGLLGEAGLPDPPTVADTEPTTGQIPMGPAPGDTGFAHYQLAEELGRGGMGVVYKAHDTVLGRVVALKMIRAGVLARPDEVERFYREARAAAQLRHPHIVPLYEISRQADQHYFTMAYAPGGSLAQQRQRFADAPRAAAALVEKVARAVHCAHLKGILHRDLKPGNVLLDENGEPLVSDFGLAKFLDADAELTQMGTVVGTPAYMAPEQATGQPGVVTARSDIWALGVMLFELLTGRRPFAGQGLKVVSQQILTVDPPRPRSLRPGLDRALETIVLKCLEKEPNRRYATAEALADDLGCWLRGEPIQARPEAWPRRCWRAVRRHSLAVTTALLVAAAAVAVVVAIRWRDADRPNQQPDPDRIVKHLRSQLAAGKPVTLIGNTGGPEWSKWQLGPGAIMVCPYNDRTFYIQSSDPCLLELLPAPLPERYVLRAQVRHISDRGGEVGLYFAYHQSDPTKGPEHCYCELVFCHWQDHPRVKLQLCKRPGPGKALPANNEGTTGFSQALQPAPPGKEWRNLEIKVTPELITVSCDDKPIEAVWGQRRDRALTRAALVKRAQEFLRGSPELDPETAFPPRGSVGLCVSRGGAAFRRVVIQPIK